MRRVEIGQAIERIRARRSVVEERRLRGVLPVQRALGRNHAGKDRGVAFGLLDRVVGSESHREIVGDIPEELRPEADIVLVVEVVLLAHVIENAVALRSREGQR